MWPFNHKQSILSSNLLDKITDYHSHILPSVDDGVQDLNEAILTLQALEEYGVREIWLTPHIMEDCPNEPAELREHFSQLCHTYAHSAHANGEAIKLHLAAEHMLDSLFIKRFNEGDLMPIDDSPSSAHAPYLLVETSYFNPPVNLYNLLEGIRKKGFTPLLAHPERYRYMTQRDYDHLRDMHVMLQLNLLSLAGAYGEEVRCKAHKLLKGGYYTLFGTDLHRLTDFQDYVTTPCLTVKEIQLLNKLSNRC
jgi:tyrosine-protein phosphatase YwqE